MRIDSEHRFWRRLVGWVAVYALVLQGIVAGLASARLAAADVPPGHELCLHDSDQSGIASDELPEKQDRKQHCPLCLAGAHQVVAPARVSVPGFVFSPADDAFWAAEHQVAVRSFGFSPKRSRAPPAAA